MQGKDTCSPEAISNSSGLYKTMQLCLQRIFHFALICFKSGGIPRLCFQGVS